MATTAPPAKEPAKWSTKDYRVCTQGVLGLASLPSLLSCPSLSFSSVHGIRHFGMWYCRCLGAHVFAWDFIVTCNDSHYSCPASSLPPSSPSHSAPCIGSSKSATSRKPSPFMNKVSGCTSTGTKNSLPAAKLLVMDHMVDVGVRQWWGGGRRMSSLPLN